MRIVLAAEGTRGDVHPVLALAELLRRRGADVMVCAPPVFAGDARERGIELQVDAHGREGQRVAERDQVGCSLGSLNPGDACDQERIPFGYPVLAQCVERGRRHEQPAFRDRDAVSLGLGADIDHPGTTLRVQVGEAALVSCLRGGHRSGASWRS